MHKFTKNLCAAIGISGRLAGVVTASPAQATTVPILQATTYIEQAPDEIDSEDVIEQELISFEAEMVAASEGTWGKYPGDSRVASFEIPVGCAAVSGGNDATKFTCGGKSYEFSPIVYSDDGSAKDFRTFLQSGMITVEAVKVPRTAEPITFSLVATESVPDGIMPDEIVDSVLEMAREDQPFATSAELDVEEQELNDGLELDVEPLATHEAESQASVAGRPSKVGIPSGYRYCSAWNRLVAKKKGCTPSALHDYCTWSPNKPQFQFGDHTGQVDFRGPCARHDMGIAKIVKQGGGLSTKKNKRKKVDITFRSQMYQNCANAFYTNNRISKGLKGSCRSTASLYYTVVKRATNKWNGK